MTIPVVLIAGFSQVARHRVIREALDRLPARPGSSSLSPSPASRIAWLDHQDSLGAALDSHSKRLHQPLRQPLCQPNKSFVACVCCAGSLVFTTHLTQLLRQGPWVGLIISLGARAEPLRVMDMLTQAPWREYLDPAQLYSVMDATSLALCQQQNHAMHDLACQQRDLARQVLEPGQGLPENLFANS
jgi:hypothetical protein